MALQEFAPVNREQIAMEFLPERIKWQKAENILKLDPGRCFLARDLDSRPVIGVVEDTALRYVHVDEVPPINEPFSARSEQISPEWRVQSPQWSNTAKFVDMRTTVDMSFIDSRYAETVFYSPVAMFVKSTLSRARSLIGVDAKLKQLICSPDALGEKYMGREFHVAGMQQEYIRWKDQLNGDLAQVSKAEFALRQKETQLQVVILLEIYSRDPSYGLQLDAHFDRLLLWQALDDARGDSVVEFCQNVLWSFFRQSCRDKVSQLYMRARGKAPESSKKPVSKTAMTTALRSASRSASLLARARSIQFPTQRPVSPATASATKTLNDQTLSRVHRHASQRREVEVSFRSQSPALPARPQNQSQAPSIKRGSRQEKSNASTQTRKRIMPSRVYATPIANRVKHVKVEPIDMPDLEIGSTDEDD